MLKAFTGERFLPNLQGEIRLEHYHRYAFALELVKGKTVLDLACGEGYGSFMFSKYASAVLGVDLSNEVISHAQKKYANKTENLHFQQGSASKLALQDAVFDVVVSYETIEHLYEQSEMLEEIRRVLKPDGILIISSPNKPVYSKNGEYQNHFHVKELDFSEFNKLLKKQFKAVEYFGQRLQIGSIIKSIEQNKDYFKAWSDDGRLIKPETAKLLQPVYYIAVCAAKPQYLPEVSPSVFYPNKLDLLAQYQGYAAWAKSTDVAIDEARRLIQTKEEEHQKIAAWALGLQAQVDARQVEIGQLNELITQRDQKIAKLETAVKRGELALGLIKDLNNKQDELNKILRSNSWRITKPLREVRRWIFSPIKQVKRYAIIFLNNIKKRYQSFAFSEVTKNKHKSFLEKTAPWVLRFTCTSSFYAHQKPVNFTPISSYETIQVDLILPTFSRPIVSVVIPVYGKVRYTLACLKSIKEHPPKTPYEVIVVDDCSQDNSAEILSKIDGLRIYSNTENKGFIQSCNFGASVANGDYVYFLNNDTQVTANWLDALYETYKDFPGVGFVGSKLVYPDGVLQEAGGIIWQDGSAWNYGRNQDAMSPEFNYAREVDFCSGASIMVPKKIFDDIGGFDKFYMPAYCEDCDLALKIKSKGLKVIYQPLSTVIHFEGVTSGTYISAGVKSYQVENMKKLYQRWSDTFQSHSPNGFEPISEKDRSTKKRVLVLDLCTPAPNKDAGSLLTYNLMLLLRDFGFQVTFIPVDNFLFIPEDTELLQKNGIEVIYHPYCSILEDYLKNNKHKFDFVFMFRPQVVDRFLSLIRKYLKDAKVLFHTVDLHFLRMERQSRHEGNSGLLEQSKEMKIIEYNAIKNVDSTIVVSMKEAEILEKELPDSRVNVLPLLLYSKIGEIPDFDCRKNILFVGGFQHAPNVDAAIYLAREIYPLLKQKIKDVELLIIGQNPPPEVQSLNSGGIKVTGYVEDLEAIFDQVKVSVAPLRFGAGIKGKVASSLNAGVPVVASSIAIEGMGLDDGDDVCIANSPKEFANAIEKLYLDKKVWEKISQNCLKTAERLWGRYTIQSKFIEILNEIDVQIDQN